MSKTEKAPFNNMGLEITVDTVKAPENNRVLIDWCSWTLKVDDPFEAIKKSGLSSMPWKAGKCGAMGYKQSLRSGSAVVFFDGSDQMGCHISLTGQACREYEKYRGSSNCWYQLFHTLTEAGAKITRLDIAIDNVDGALNLDKLQKACEKKTVRTLFERAERIEGLLLHDDPQGKKSQKCGKTIYLGGKGSKVKFCFYDKAAEQKTTDGVPWVRCELRLMAERAQEAVKHILSGIDAGVLAVSVLNTYFSVVNNDSSNKSRCTHQRWWANWIKSTDKLRLTVAKAKKLLPEVMDFMSRQYGATVAMISEGLGQVRFYDWLISMRDEGIKKMTMKHEKILFDSAVATDMPF